MAKKFSLFLVTVILLSALYVPASASLSYSGPLTITKGGTYSGNFRSQLHSVPAIIVNTTEPVIIENANILSRGVGIDCWGYSNVTVRNCTIKNENPKAAGVAFRKAINADRPSNFIVENNYIENSWGVYVQGFTGDGTNGTIKIRYNQFLNTEGRFCLDPSGTLGADRELAHAVQFNGVTGINNSGVKNIEVSWNQFINEPYKSSSEDVINFFCSSGAADSPILCHNNYIFGAYPPDPLTMGYSGGGIITDGHSGDTVNPRYIRIYDNIVTATTNYGVAIAAGNNCTIEDNIVVNSGRLDDGSLVYTRNVGIYIANLAGISTFGQNKAYGNTVGWIGVHPDPNEPTAEWRNDFWFPDAADTDGQNSIPGSWEAITREYEKSFVNVWHDRLEENNVEIGLSTVAHAVLCGFTKTGNKITIENYCGRPVTASVWFAAQNEDLVVRAAEILSAEATCQHGETVEIPYTAPSIKGETLTYRAFFWNEKMQPYAKSATK